jgi:hypothetical protein
MTETVIASIISGLTSTLTPNPVYATFDQTKPFGAVQTVVSATTEPSAFDAAGTPIAWQTGVNATVVTHQHTDKSGSVRAADATKCFNYFRALTTLSGITLHAVTSVSQSEVSQVDENYGATTVSCTLIHQ